MKFSRTALIFPLALLLGLVLAGCAHAQKGGELAGDRPEPMTPAQVLEKARRVLAALEERLPRERAERPNVLTQICRLCFLSGDLSPREQKEAYFYKGQTYAEILVKEQPAWADGHYWLALNLGGLAEIRPARQGMKLLPQILEQAEKALAIDPTYDQAGPHRVLGRIYFEAPAWPLSVGDLNKSLRHLRAAVQIAPDNSTNHLFLAETLERMGKKAEARQELERVLRSIRHNLGPQGLEEDYQEARRLLGYSAKTGEDQGEKR